jgi:hypothetical protein
MEILLNECSDYMLTYELLNLLNTCNESPIDNPVVKAPIVEAPIEEAPIVKEKPVIKAPHNILSRIGRQFILVYVRKRARNIRI